MLLRVPSFYSKFACTAARCADSCCIGWEIDVDELSAARYHAVPGAFGDRLRASLVGTPPHFAQTADGRCAFLDKTGLCDIYRTLGEGALCDICTGHPRFYNPLPNITEAGLGLCCEEAARLLLCCEEFPSFCEYETDFSLVPVFEEGFSDDTVYADALLQIRQAFFALCKNRSLPFGMRLALLPVLAGEASEVLCEEGDTAALCAQWEDDAFLSEISDAVVQQTAAKAAGISFLQKTLSFLATQPPLQKSWPAQLLQLAADLESNAWNSTAFFDQNPEFCERIVCYYLYRWLPQALESGELTKLVLFAMAASLVTNLKARSLLAKTGVLSMDAQIEAAKAFSKEVEYAPGLPLKLVDAMADFGEYSVWAAAAML